MNYWLMKTEPSVFGIDDLMQKPKKTEHWDGVRNYQARNFMQEMQKGDEIFIYHSSCDQPGIVGIATVVKEAYPDFTAWDPKSKYFDEKSTAIKPRWYMVDIKHKRRTKRLLSLTELKTHKKLSDMTLLRKGNRLSVMPVEDKYWQHILSLE